jgi:hypothetical protein
LHHTPHPFGADIAAKIFVGFALGGFRAGHQNKSAIAAIFGIEFHDRMSGRAATCEKIQNNVIGFGGNAENALN